MAKLTVQEKIDTFFGASAKAFKEKGYGELWRKFVEEPTICDKLMWRGIEISKHWLEEKQSTLYQNIMKTNVGEEDINIFLSELDGAFKNEDVFIRLRSSVEEQVKFGEGIITKINEEEKKIQKKIDDLKTRVHPRELEEFRKSGGEATPKALDEPQTRWG